MLTTPRAWVLCACGSGKQDLGAFVTQEVSFDQVYKISIEILFPYKAAVLKWHRIELTLNF